ncbi:HEAT repeat domain-containing protein [Aggregicoccus sp. 17bor-14]|uniref:HEAT repeat domain-containing protein n=1 Tax=Myxococcaceae TaxID=31 RepID=UPI00129C7557|nr:MULTISPECIES: HEAT repeat domain-containing protein [Myxococcaceae]MBF5043653.1 HEAT repeat domain-containing protein [Simulacricoccus sp. 17bor-14]MRI89412.1 HEAT repeat domain-containing protein [Aggregicoccus sp. 17bor-14]
MTRSRVALCLVLSSLVGGLAASTLGCNRVDPDSPEYWDKTLSRTRRVADEVRVVDAMRGSGHVDKRFLPMLHERLGEARAPELKSALARVLGSIKDPSSVEPLTRAISANPRGGDNGANGAIAAALAQIGDARAIPALVKLLAVPDNYTRVEAINALGAIRAKEAVEPLAQLATDDHTDAQVAKRSIEALGRIGDARAVPALVKMLTQERRNVSFYPESSFALFQLGRPAGDALLPVLEGKDAQLASWAQGRRILPASYYSKAAQVLGDLRDRRAEGALMQRLAFSDSDPRIQAIVRMQAADALGRMRTQAAIKPLTAMLVETDPVVRAAYVRALVHLGGRDAIPALQKAATQGNWWAREAAVEGITLLGDARELPLLQKLAAAEPAATQAECQKQDYDGCDEAPKLGQERAAAYTRLSQRLQAAQACGQDAACWGARLQDPKADAGVVRRAALELGRAASAAHADALVARLDERDTETRATVIQALDWMVEGNKDAGAKVRAALPRMNQQLEQERGRTEFMKVNEDLRRLVVRLQRTEA